MRSRLENHIKTVVGRYKGKVNSWDVVNEVLSDGSGLRGINDDSWLDNFPFAGRLDETLIFDRKLQAKPAYWAIVDPSRVAVYRRTAKTVNVTLIIGDDIDAQWSMASSIDANTAVTGATGATARVKTTWDI